MNKQILLPLILLTSLASATGPKLTEFDRDTIIDEEGYWASPAWWTEDVYKGKYPQPIAHEHPWPGKQEFVEKLAAIESLANLPNSKIHLWGTKGPCFSRLERTGVANGMYWYKKNGSIHFSVGWTEAFRPYYVEKFNVKPSREFYEFVMNLDIDSITK